MTGEVELGYSGRENLDAMEHARNYNAYLLDLIRRHVAGPEVMDFGAGAGTFAIPAARRYPRVVCVEPDASLAHHLRAVAGLEVFTDIRAVPAASVDAIYSFNVLEHIEDDEMMLHELRQRLRSGGTLLLYVPAFNLLFSSMDRKVGHFRRYRRGCLERRLRRAGFEIVLSRYADSIGFLAALTYKLIGDRSGVISAGSVRAYDTFVFPVSRTLDHAAGTLFGKNVIAVARRP